LSARQELHLLPVADFLTSHAVDRRSDAVENDDRTLCVHQNRLIVLVELFAGLEVEILAGLAAPVDLALAVVIGFDVPLQLAKERFRIFHRLAAAVSGPRR
jgi:hypothetical protein